MLPSLTTVHDIAYSSYIPIIDFWVGSVRCSKILKNNVFFDSSKELSPFIPASGFARQERWEYSEGSTRFQKYHMHGQTLVLRYFRCKICHNLSVALLIP